MTCCPPNLERTFSSLPGYFYSTAKDGLYVHLFDNSLLDWHLEDGTPIKVRQKTNYPWEGEIQITVMPAETHQFTLYLRIPWWAEGATGTNGWVIDGGAPPDNPDEVDRADANALYRLLEEEIVPAFYDRGADNIPRRWLSYVKESIRTVAPRFSARRMVKEYAERMYRGSLTRSR